MRRPLILRLRAAEGRAFQACFHSCSQTQTKAMVGFPFPRSLQQSDTVHQHLRRLVPTRRGRCCVLRQPWGSGYQN